MIVFLRLNGGARRSAGLGIIAFAAFAQIGLRRLQARACARDESSGAAAGSAALRSRRGDRFVHDAPDGARTASALRTATEALIHVASRAGRRVAARKSCAHVVVGEHVTGADNHRGMARTALVSSATIAI